MMGHGHAVMGAAAWVTLTSSSLAGLGHLPGEQVIVGSVVTAGAALLPDADHHSATISRSLPPVSGWMARGIAGIAGGHRQGTHSLIGLAAFALLALVLTNVRAPVMGTDFQVGAWLLTVLLVAFAAKALRLTRGWLSCWILATAAASTLIWFAPTAAWWLPLSIGVGVAIHILGDLLTDQGVALLWPWSNERIALPLLGTAGSVREWLLVGCLYVYLIWVGLGSYLEQVWLV